MVLYLWYNLQTSEEDRLYKTVDTVLPITSDVVAENYEKTHTHTRETTTVTIIFEALKVIRIIIPGTYAKPLNI